MKKHKIEDIFSSMEDFSSVPPPELWAQIEEKLDKPKKKKRVILWWSAAACLLLGLLLPSILHFTAPENKNFDHNNFDSNKVVLEEKTNDASKNSTLKQNGNNSEVTDSLQNSSSSEKQFNATPKEIQEQKAAVANASVNSKNKTNKNGSESSMQLPNANVPNQSLAVQHNSLENTSKNGTSKNSILENNKQTSNKGIAEERIAFGKQKQFNSTAKKQLSNSIFEDLILSKNNKNLAFSKQNNDRDNSVFNQNSEKAPNVNTSAELAYKINSKENAASSKNNSLSKVDSVQLAILQNLEKGIAIAETKKEEKDKKDNLINKKERWAVAVFAGVASSENTRNEKTLGNTNDSKQSNSYGVRTKYSINKKWAVGSGLKINELGQSVANVSYVSAKSNTLFLPDANYANSASSAPIVTTSDYLLVSNSTKEALKNDNNIQTGKLDQNLRYIEMPLEVSYSLFNKNKASINLNTGGFVGKLISNNVALDGNSIGQNVNANDYVYGSTLSSTVQYRVYKKTNVFVEPAVNYYINPLNTQSFNQFQWGLNFGLNVSF